MNFLVLTILLSTTVFAEDLSFKTFSVDTSVDKLKAVQQKETAIDNSTKKKSYDPSKKYQMPINPFSRDTNLNLQEDRNRAARGQRQD